MDFKDKLKALRSKRRLTQRELSDIMGIQSVQISHLECGQQFPSYEMLISLCKALKCTPNNLVVVK